MLFLFPNFRTGCYPSHFHHIVQILHIHSQCFTSPRLSVGMNETSAKGFSWGNLNLLGVRWDENKDEEHWLSKAGAGSTNKKESPNCFLLPKSPHWSATLWSQPDVVLYLSGYLRAICFCFNQTYHMIPIIRVSLPTARLLRTKTISLLSSIPRMSLQLLPQEMLYKSLLNEWTNEQALFIFMDTASQHT